MLTMWTVAAESSPRTAFMSAPTKPRSLTVMELPSGTPSSAVPLYLTPLYLTPLYFTPLYFDSVVLHPVEKGSVEEGAVELLGVVQQQRLRRLGHVLLVPAVLRTARRTTEAERSVVRIMATLNFKVISFPSVRWHYQACFEQGDLPSAVMGS